MTKIGLFFGTFNPIHNGHLMVANYMVENSDLDRILFVPSPNVPFKDTNNELLPFSERCSLIEMATYNNPKLSFTAIEERLEQPTYTYNTLKYMQDGMNGIVEYVLILGSDNIKEMYRWHRYRDILKEFEVYVALRGHDTGVYIEKYISDMSRKDDESFACDNFKGYKILYDCPISNLSSTLIRKEIKKDHSISFYVPEKVETYIKKMKWYNK